MERFTKMLVLCTEFMRIHKRGLVNSLHLATVLKNLRKSRPRRRTFRAWTDKIAPESFKNRVRTALPDVFVDV